jgi:hypothetical protein
MYVLRTLRLQKLSSKCSGQDCKKSKNYLGDEITKCYLNFRENSGDYKMFERNCNNEVCNIARSNEILGWAGKALETVNCCAFLKRRLIGAC